MLSLRLISWKINQLQVRALFFNIASQCKSVCTIWKNEKFSLTEKKIRQINYLVIYLKLLVSQIHNENLTKGRWKKPQKCITHKEKYFLRCLM